MYDDQNAFDSLCYYTLAHGVPRFIHQHAVDAFAAQTVTERDKPMKLIFALVGLYLYLERDFNGREVQLAHVKMARHKQTWPIFALPENRGHITVGDVLASPAGPERDDMIRQWCISTWESYSTNRAVIVSLLTDHLII